jgi:hypothetical protein
MADENSETVPAPAAAELMRMLEQKFRKSAANWVGLPGDMKQLTYDYLRAAGRAADPQYSLRAVAQGSQYSASRVRVADKH